MTVIAQLLGYVAGYITTVIHLGKITEKIMKTEEFNKCREFLENAISEHPENGEFLVAYQKLIELKSCYDKETDKARIEKEIREAEFNTQYQTAVHSNNTDYNKAVNQNNTDYNTAVHANNTNFDINNNNNQAQVFQNQQNQRFGLANNMVNNGLFGPQGNGV